VIIEIIRLPRMYARAQNILGQCVSVVVAHCGLSPTINSCAKIFIFAGFPATLSDVFADREKAAGGGLEKWQGHVRYCTRKCGYRCHGRIVGRNACENENCIVGARVNGVMGRGEGRERARWNTFLLTGLAGGGFKRAETWLAKSRLRGFSKFRNTACNIDEVMQRQLDKLAQHRLSDNSHFSSDAIQTFWQNRGRCKLSSLYTQRARKKKP
jgi:hypothetical protein